MLTLQSRVGRTHGKAVQLQAFAQLKEKGGSYKVEKV